MSYCTVCGTKLIEKECINYGLSEGMIPFCEKCNDFRFPKFNTAISAVIFSPDKRKILLIQQYEMHKNILVGGYVNKTENLEHAVIREIKEEIGLDVSEIHFNKSEYFAKTDSLLCNFVAVATDENLTISQEVDYANWYDIKTAKEVIYKNSLAERFLISAIEKISKGQIKFCDAIFEACTQHPTD